MVHGLDRDCPTVPPPPLRAVSGLLPAGQAAPLRAGIFRTKRRALAEKRAIERGRDELVENREVDLERAGTLFGDYVATKWWRAWKDQHPTSEYGSRKKVEKRILPTFGDIPLGDLDASTIGAWRSAMVGQDGDDSFVPEEAPCRKPNCSGWIERRGPA